MMPVQKITSMRLLPLKAAALAVLLFAQAAVASNTCGGYPSTTCPEGHQCCAKDSGDPSGFCCPLMTTSNETYSCAFGVGGLGEDRENLRVQNCCAGRPVCGVGVGERYCCMGARSRLHSSGCSAVGPPVCCNTMCGDDLCDTECKWMGGVCKAGSSAEGGSCKKPITGKDLPIPPLV
mmetsp:Transcript_7283/g.16511  ORF Transcript_7283/g.16511 Transcript_7283/m.16511 type:complete len:178 (+) Transcript_7283:167-700(+)|eukprot:CAMPEP_0206461148 /NCGR_PEP_ID=MMETSP0324_2-20121206/25177_1 /ASSEMBLY_ACC=CAM_ASM_000836 /TAXON_ID=2866 /ORGANISM="Crypthecodinium cohnii, Strain Seligo" /LENGTH=177 /DNA_ID=CAMNT_0053932991 /DNA_START=167 /DNA_END=700 /DNA_ORIENTATION=+